MPGKSARPKNYRRNESCKSRAPPQQYNPVRVPALVPLARLLVSTAVSFTGIQIEVAKRDVSIGILVDAHPPSLSLAMRTELPGARYQHLEDFALFYLDIPFGLNGAPVNFAIFGEAISKIHSLFGTNRPGRHTSLSFTHVHMWAMVSS